MKGKIISGLAALALTASCAQQTTTIASQHVTTPEEVSVEQVSKPEKDESIWQQYLDKINPSVFCIRDSALYEFDAISQLSGKEKKVGGFAGGHGSGTVVQEIEYEGRTEYLILTNYHVGYAADIVNGGKLIEQKLFLVDNEEDMFKEDDIKLERMAGSPDNDMMFLRTINAPKLPVAKMKFGLPKELNGDDRLFTSGFPLAKDKQTNEGQISSTAFYEGDLVPFPLEVYSANISIDSGQSGSPVVIPVKENGETVFYCVGLIYAKASTTDTIRLITPIEKAEQLFATMKDVPSKRPQLTARITKEKIATLDQVYTINGKGLEVRCKDSRCEMDIYLMAGSNAITQEHLRTVFTLGVEKIDVESILYKKGDEITELRQGNEDDDLLVAALINYSSIQEQSADLKEKFNRTSTETRRQKYLDRVVMNDQNTLAFDMRAFFYGFYQNEQISEHYMR